MMLRLYENRDAVTLVLVNNNRSTLVLSPPEFKDLINIIKLLNPFKTAAERLSSENNVTISLILSIFENFLIFNF